MTKNAMSNDLQGVVRGFKESKQSASGFNNMRLEDIVWTFQLERHGETGERLDPIPVEMRGKYFSGFINEGNVVRLYEKSWQGGIVRTKRVHNVTFKEDIMADRKPTKPINRIVTIITIMIILFIVYMIRALFGPFGPGLLP
jgi:hypothetical protein